MAAPRIEANKIAQSQVAEAYHRYAYSAPSRCVNRGDHYNEIVGEE